MPHIKRGTSTQARLCVSVFTGNATALITNEHYNDEIEEHLGAETPLRQKKILRNLFLGNLSSCCRNCLRRIKYLSNSISIMTNILSCLDFAVKTQKSFLISLCKTSTLNTVATCSMHATVDIGMEKLKNLPDILPTSNAAVRIHLFLHLFSRYCLFRIPFPFYQAEH